MIQALEGLLVRGQKVVRSQVVFDVEKGVILDVGDLKIPRSQIDFYYDDHCLVFAGMGDVHIHAREDVSGKQVYKEDFQSARRAALNGGVVHLADMPNNPIPPIDDLSYEKKFKLTMAKSGQGNPEQGIPILLYAGIGPHTFPLTQKVPYKVYMGPSIGDLYFESLKQMEKVLKHYRGQDISFHCEDPEILKNHEGERLHERKRPEQAEILATDKAIYLIGKYEINGKLCHFSTRDGLMLIQEGRNKKLQIECEVTPQHLYFNQEHLAHLSAQEKIHFQMNPPIRHSKDQEALLDALREGMVDYLATDHAPHSPIEKDQGISGLTGLDTYGPFVTWLIKKQGISPQMINRVCCENPGKFFNRYLPTYRELHPYFKTLGHGFGFIEKGYSASFTVLNMENPITITKSYLKTKPQLSPFEGHTFPGRVEAVLVSSMLIDLF